MIEANTYKIKRFDIPEYKLRGKKHLSPDEERKLLNNKGYIEEKVDGKTTSFPYPENEKYVIFAEDLLKTHTIFYKLPSRFLVFDIYSEDRGFLEPKEKIKLCLKFGLIPVPLIYHGKIKDKAILKDLVALHVSAFETQINPKMVEVLEKYNDIDNEKLRRKNFMEGVVVKLYEDGKLYAGKVVDPFFEEIIDKVGRYEDYPHENIITPWDREKYVNYFKKQLDKLNYYILDDDLEEGYEIYISNFDYWKNPKHI